MIETRDLEEQTFAELEKLEGVWGSYTATLNADELRAFVFLQDRGYAAIQKDTTGSRIMRTYPQGSGELDLSAIRAEQARPSVKPLEWSVASHNEDKTDMFWVGCGLHLTYRSRLCDGKYSLGLHYAGLAWDTGVCLRSWGKWDAFDTLEAAKAAAQTDYSQRILSALVTPSTTTEEKEEIARDAFGAGWLAALDMQGRQSDDNDVIAWDRYRALLEGDR